MIKAHVFLCISSNITKERKKDNRILRIRVSKVLLWILSFSSFEFLLLWRCLIFDLQIIGPPGIELLRIILSYTKSYIFFPCTNTSVTMWYWENILYGLNEWWLGTYDHFMLDACDHICLGTYDHTILEV